MSSFLSSVMPFAGGGKGIEVARFEAFAAGFLLFIYGV